MSDTQVPAPSPVKPGIKSTEFYVTILVSVVNALVLADVFPIESVIAKIISVISITLSGLGYTMIRGKAKAGGGTSSAGLALLAAGILGTSGASGFGLTACGPTIKDAGRAVAGDVVDCGRAEVADLALQFAPTVVQLIQRATGADNRVDPPSLDAAFGSLKEAGWCVVEKVAARVRQHLPALPGAPQSSALEVDAAHLDSSLAELRGRMFPGKTFRVEAE